MAGKRVSLASLASAKVEAVPGAGRPDLVHVHPDTVAPTPLNPRRDFDETALRELGEDMRSGQLQPCVAVTKSAYLKLYPEHADQLSDGCRYVMAAGERRWKAAALVGLDTVDVLLRHDLTESRIRFLAAVLSENVQRANFNPIEEAHGLHAMLELHDGNQSAAAKAMGKSKAWFNQRIGLMRLTEDMVKLVLDGKLTAFRDMRRYASMPPEKQYTAWKTDQEQPRPAPPPRQPERPEPAPETYTAVYAPDPPETTPADSGPRLRSVPPVEQTSGPAEFHSATTTDAVVSRPAPVRDEQPAEAAPAPARHLEPAPVEAIPEPRQHTAVEETVPQPNRPFPYNNPGEAAMALDKKSTEDNLFGLVEILIRTLLERNPDRMHDTWKSAGGQ